MGRRKTKNVELKGKGVSSFSIQTRQYKQEIVNKVFNIPLLLEKIVQYAIHKPEGTITDRKVVVSTRLVNKSWLRSTSHVLRQIGSPAIKIEIGLPDKVAKLNTNMFRKNGNILDQLVSVFSKVSRFNESVLPVHLLIKPHYFIQESSASLTNFFEQCGNIISFLGVNFPLDYCSVEFDCGRYQFPLLKLMGIFIYTAWNLPRESNGLEFFQEILRSSNTLQKLDLRYDESAKNISSLCLPNSIRILHFKSSISSNELALLTKNQLPNLSVLGLSIQKMAEEDVVSRILERFQHQLTIFQIEFIAYNNQSNISINFPLMEKLKTLIVHSQGFDLAPESQHNWSKQLPNLEKLEANEIIQTSFINCFQGSKFDSVKDVNAVMKRRVWETAFLPESPNVSGVETIRDSFPNIQRLTLWFKFEENSGLKCLFRNFPHLKELNLDISFDIVFFLTRSLVVSLFLGTSSDMTWNIIWKREKDINVPLDNPESIMNMKELHTLTIGIQGEALDERPEDPFGFTIISKYGFERMKKLKEIKLRWDSEDTGLC